MEQKGGRRCEAADHQDSARELINKNNSEAMAPSGPVEKEPTIAPEGVCFAEETEFEFCLTCFLAT